jgi:hypothetical protein
MEKDRIDKHIFKDWLNHPITKIIQSRLIQRKDKAYSHIKDINSQNYLAIGKNIGKLESIDDILNIRYEDIEENY